MNFVSENTGYTERFLSVLIFQDYRYFTLLKVGYYFQVDNNFASTPVFWQIFTFFDSYNPKKTLSANSSDNSVNTEMSCFYEQGFKEQAWSEC